MHDPHPVEVILARLLPTALSETGRQDIEEMIDEVSKSSEVSSATPARHSPWTYRIVAGSIAAAGMLAAFIDPSVNPSNHRVTAAPLAQTDPGFVLVGESVRVQSMVDEGWIEDADGSAMQAMRVNVIEENTLRDEESGMVMSISEPREELLLMPISTF